MLVSRSILRSLSNVQSSVFLIVVAKFGLPISLYLFDNSLVRDSLGILIKT